ncbi:hypothetical protein C8R47DRAFT_1288238 [Mycena vitilis]|nr:hypothetical protein C8R47DRAFT_1288238 [Mycena vitilis]
MSSQGARAYFGKLAGVVGVRGTGQGTMNASPYSFRANFGTGMLKAAGQTATAGAMGHRADSFVVCENYNDGNHRIDFFGIASGEQQSDQLQHGRNIATYAAPVTVPKLGIEGLIQRAPMIAILLKQANNLQSWIANGGEEAWQDEDWKELVFTRDILEDGDGPASVLKWTLARIKRLSARAQQQNIKETQEQAARDLRANITVSERMERMEALAQPSDLPARLRAVREKMIRLGIPPTRREPEDHEYDADLPPIVIAEPGAEDRDDEEDNSSAAIEKEMIKFMCDLAEVEELKPDAIYCDQCELDPTCSVDDVNKDWVFPSKLAHHQETFHSLINRCQRFLESCDARSRSESGRYIWKCPWDGKGDTESRASTVGSVVYFSKAYLIRHIITDHTRDEMDPEEYDVMKKLYDEDGGKAFSRRPVGASKGEGSSSKGGGKGGGSGGKGGDKGGGKGGGKDGGKDLDIDKDEDDADDSLTCAQCAEDPSLPDKRRTVRFKNASGKKAHMAAQMHSADKRAVRMLKKDSATHLSKGGMPCPYCYEFDGGNLLDVSLHITHDHEDELDTAVYDVYEQAVAFFVVATPLFLSDEDRSAAMNRISEDIWAHADDDSMGEDEAWYGDDGEGSSGLGDEGSAWGGVEQLRVEARIWDEAGGDMEWE